MGTLKCLKCGGVNSDGYWVEIKRSSLEHNGTEAIYGVHVRLCSIHQLERSHSASKALFLGKMSRHIFTKRTGVDPDIVLNALNCFTDAFIVTRFRTAISYTGTVNFHQPATHALDSSTVQCSIASYRAQKSRHCSDASLWHVSVPSCT